MRKEKNIYNQQITARLTNDLVNRVDAICEAENAGKGFSDKKLDSKSSS